LILTWFGVGPAWKTGEEKEDAGLDGVFAAAAVVKKTCLLRAKDQDICWNALPCPSPQFRLGS
jgi:hypothetical protein